MAEPRFDGRVLFLAGVHMHGHDMARRMLSDRPICAGWRKSPWKGWTAMEPSSKEQLGQLGPVRVVDLVSEGSPAVLTLQIDPGGKSVATVAAALSLVRRGLSMLQAKRAMERLIEEGEVTIKVPRVEDRELLARDLVGAGVITLAVGAQDIDVKELRESLDLTQEQFALRYGLELDAVRNWEHGRRVPDTAARNYLCAIQRMPKEMKSVLEEIVDIPAISWPHRLTPPSAGSR